MESGWLDRRRIVCGWINGQRDGPTDRWNWNPSSFQPPSSISKPASLSKFFLFFDYLFSWKYTLSYATWYIIVYKFHKLYNNFLNISLVLSNQIPSPPRLVLRSMMGKPLVRVNCWYRIMCVLLYFNKHVTQASWLELISQLFQCSYNLTSIYSSKRRILWTYIQMYSI